MAIKKRECRFVVTFGYHEFLMPKGCTEEDVKGFFGAYAIEGCYGNSRERKDTEAHIQPVSKIKVKARLVCVDNIDTIYYNDKELNEFWQAIAHQVADIFDAKSIRTPIRFAKDGQIRVGEEDLKYENLQDPNNPKADPKVIVAEIVASAKKQEKNWDL